MSKIKAAIFDADGTLLNSMQIWGELGERYLRSLNVTPEKNLAAILYPMSLSQSSEYLKENYGLEISSSEIRAGLLKTIENFYRNEVLLKDGVKNFLESFSVPKVVASLTEKEFLQAAFIRNGVNDFFSEVFSCDDKHSPKIFLECAEFFNLPPENIAVFDDTLYALDAAKSAGFITVGISDDSNIFYRQKIIELSNYFIDDWRNFFHENSFNYCGQ